ncbi:transmembrane protein 209 isoform X2 [Centruroides vittatus]
MTNSRWQHTVVEDILQRKIAVAKSKWALPWALINFTIATLFCLDINHGSISRCLPGNPPVIWYIEVIIACIFTLNGLYNAYLYVWPTIGQSPLELTPVYRKLFKIKDNDIGFKYASTEFNRTSSPKSKVSAVMPNFVLPSANYVSHLSNSSSFSSLNSSLDHLGNNWTNSSGMTSPNASVPSNSWMYTSFPSPYQFQNTSPNISAFPSYNAINENSRLRNRWDSTLSSSGQSEGSSGNISSFWNYPHSSMPFTPILRKYQYQPATRSPQSSTIHDSDPDSSATQSGDGMWSKLKISEDQLTILVANLRKWISQTILVKLISEIEVINDDLRRLGSAELQIGEVSLTTLRQVALTKSQHLPTLNGLLPYLDITSNQEYLFHRLKELARSGCMSEFHWNGGGSFKGKPWSDHLPTDCAIVMHVLCTYMDSRLPPDPHYPDGKTFTSQYFKKTPDKLDINKDTLCIYQSRVIPPHYRVVIGEETWDFAKGRNNMFFAILFFLLHVKTELCGMLG